MLPTVSVKAPAPERTIRKVSPLTAPVVERVTVRFAVRVVAQRWTGASVPTVNVWDVSPRSEEVANGRR